jgi:SH3-like domain-containing protein
MRSRNNSKSKVLPQAVTVQRHIKLPVIIGLTISGLLMALLPSMALALDYRSIAAPKAVLFDAPSGKGKKLFVIGQGYPVEVIVDLGEWLKVRDQHGGLSWVEAKQLAAKRTLLVTLNQAEIRESADAASTVVCRLEKDVVLELLETATNGWAKVRHRDGLTGYILSTSVWGL